MADTSVPRVSDAELLKIFIDKTLNAKEDLGLTSSATVSFFIGANNYSVAKDSEIPEFVSKLKDSKRYGSKIHSITLTDLGMHQQCSFSYKRSDTTFIDVFKTPTQRVDDKSIMLGVHLNDLIFVNTKNAIQKSTVSDSNITSMHHDVLSRLEGLSAELITKQYDQVQKLEQDKQKFLDERGSEFADKINAQDEIYEEKLKDLEGKYQERNQQLDERQKQIDDADNTTARRKTTTKTLEEAQEKAKRFDFSENVNSLSRKAQYMSLILIIIGFSGLIFSLVELSSVRETAIKSGISYGISSNGLSVLSSSGEHLSQQLPDVSSGNTPTINSSSGGYISSSVDTSITQQYIYFLYLRIFACSALLVSSIVYLIRWYNSWANRIAQQELDNQMFIRDLNRAQLAVEMSLEWNEKKDGAIPSRLLESLTEGLFKPKDTAPQELLHPAEQIATALLKTSEKVTLPFHGGTLETTGKAIRRARTPRPKKRTQD